MKNINAVKLGKLGGEATKKKYGKKYFSKLAKKRLEVIDDLVDKSKELNTLK